MLALDIGGTKLAAAVVDPDGQLLVADRLDTPQEPGVDAERLWRLLADLADEVLARTGSPELAGVGVGCGGPMAWPEGRVSPLNIPSWRDFPLRDRLRERFPGRPVRVHNDAVCAAIGEHWRGAGCDRESMLGMVVSTGVGGGLILDGQLVDGPTGNAGHIGHVVVDPDGPACTCGGIGCLEAVARGPALAAWALERGWRPQREPTRTSPAGLSPGPPTARELADDARSGDSIAGAALQRAGRALGLALASATVLCDLELVVIGGGLAQAGPLLFVPLEETLRRHTRLDFARRVRILSAALGQQAGLVGAAALLHAGPRYWHGE